MADFGLARIANVTTSPLTNEVVTLRYRAPELLLGLREYSFGVDMWSLGCLLHDLCALNPLFDGQSEVEMIV